MAQYSSKRTVLYFCILNSVRVTITSSPFICIWKFLVVHCTLLCVSVQIIIALVFFLIPVCLVKLALKQVSDSLFFQFFICVFVSLFGLHWSSITRIPKKPLCDWTKPTNLTNFHLVCWYIIDFDAASEPRYLEGCIKNSPLPAFVFFLIRRWTYGKYQVSVWGTKHIFSFSNVTLLMLAIEIFDECFGRVFYMQAHEIVHE